MIGFTLTKVSADFGPEKIVTSNATDVIDVFQADMDGDGDIDFLAAKPGNPFFGGGARFYVEIMATVVSELNPFQMGQLH